MDEVRIDQSFFRMKRTEICKGRQGWMGVVMTQLCKGNNKETSREEMLPGE